MKAILTIIAIGAFGGYALADVSETVSLSSPVAASVDAELLQIS